MMPTVEEIARAICTADGIDPDSDVSLPYPNNENPEIELAWKCYAANARAVLALFATVLAAAEVRQ